MKVKVTNASQKSNKAMFSILKGIEAIKKPSKDIKFIIFTDDSVQVYSNTKMLTATITY